MVVFPLGPQQARLWHPGVAGIAASVAAFPVSAMIAALIARRATRLPVEPRTLAILGLIGVLPAILSTGYFTFFVARAVAGLAAGVSITAVHRALPVGSSPAAAKFAGRIVAFGMPACILAATLFDWRAACMPMGIGFVSIALIAIGSSRHGSPTSTSTSAFATQRPSLNEAVPAALIATSALAFVSGSYLTVLSGFLVFNAGHTELHIPAALLIGALLGLLVPVAMSRLNQSLAPRAVYAVTLTAAAFSVLSLLTVRSAFPATLALGLIGCFLAINAARHLALAGLVTPRLRPDDTTAHNTHTYIAHCTGSGLGAICAGLLVHATPNKTLTGMNPLLICGLTATLLALATGLAAAQPTTSPAACAAAAKSRWRVATSLLRSVRTSITRAPETPT